MCPSAAYTPADLNLFGSTASGGNEFGVFTYVMDLDLKLKSDIAKNAVVGNSFTYPTMPRITTIRNVSAQVFITEQAFSPSLENYTATPARNGILPAQRWNVFTKRHSGKGNICFLDGHSAAFKWEYVYNQNSPDNRQEKLTNPDIWWNPNRDLAKP